MTETKYCTICACSFKRCGVTDAQLDFSIRGLLLKSAYANVTSMVPFGQLSVIEKRKRRRFILMDYIMVKLLELTDCVQAFGEATGYCYSSSFFLYL